jgi:Ran GTPase-activating protein (RanGAP) involved in mRNA processing and transport
MAKCRLDDAGVAGVVAALGARHAATLVKLDVSGNRLGDAGLGAVAGFATASSALKHLNVSNNPPCTDVGLVSVFGAARACATLKYLDVGGRGLVGDVAFGVLADVLAAHPALVHLGLGGRHVTDIQARQLASAVCARLGVHMVTLRLAHHELSGPGFGFGSVARVVRHSGQTLVVLDVRGYSGRAQDPAAVVDALAQTTALCDLTLSGNRLEALSAAALGAFVAASATLVTLNVDNAHLTDTSLGLIAAGVGASKSMRWFDACSNADVSDAGGAAVAHAIGASKTLRTVKLSHMNVGDATARAIADALGVTTSLLKLVLMCTRIGNEGAVHLARALGANKSLRTLDMDWTRMDDVGAGALAAAVARTTTLVSLHLKHTRVSLAATQMFVDALKRNVDMRSLTVCGMEREGGRLVATVALKMALYKCDLKRCMLAWLGGGLARNAVTAAPSYRLFRRSGDNAVAHLVAQMLGL